MDAPAAPTGSLLGQASELEDAAQRLTARKRAEGDVSALQDALDTFVRALDDLRPTLAKVRALREHGVNLTLPSNGPDIAEDLRKLAADIDADPTAVRERRKQTDRVETYAAVVREDVDAALRKRVEEARGTAQTGLVESLRRIALDDAANALGEALSTLDKFDAQLPRDVEELRAVDSAGETIRTTFAEMDDPKHVRLVTFLRRTLAAPPPTLAEVDPALLEELQSSGAAANFTVVSRQR